MLKSGLLINWLLLRQGKQVAFVTVFLLKSPKEFDWSATLVSYARVRSRVIISWNEEWNIEFSQLKSLEFGLNHFTVENNTKIRIGGSLTKSKSEEAEEFNSTTEDCKTVSHYPELLESYDE